jgi:hypothetical protein
MKTFWIRIIITITQITTKTSQIQTHNRKAPKELQPRTRTTKMNKTTQKLKLKHKQNILQTQTHNYKALIMIIATILTQTTNIYEISQPQTKHLTIH